MGSVSWGEGTFDFEEARNIGRCPTDDFFLFPQVNMVYPTATTTDINT